MFSFELNLIEKKTYAVYGRSSSRLLRTIFSTSEFRLVFHKLFKAPLLCKKNFRQNKKVTN